MLVKHITSRTTTSRARFRAVQNTPKIGTGDQTVSSNCLNCWPLVVYRIDTAPPGTTDSSLSKQTTPKSPAYVSIAIRLAPALCASLLCALLLRLQVEVVASLRAGDVVAVPAHC